MGEISGDDSYNKKQYKKIYAEDFKKIEGMRSERVFADLYKKLINSAHKKVEEQFYKSLYETSGYCHENSPVGVIGDVNKLGEYRRLEALIGLSDLSVRGKNSRYLRDFYAETAARSHRYNLPYNIDSKEELYSAIYKGLDGDRYRLKDVERFTEKADGELRGLFAYAATNKKVSNLLGKKKLGKYSDKRRNLSLTINSEGYIVNVGIGSSDFEVHSNKKVKLY